MQVVDVDLVLDGVEAELVGLAERDARLDAAAGQPHGEARWGDGRGRRCRPAPSGVRPNSPPQMTSVSSSRPRCFRSLTSAAHGLVGVAAVLLQVVDQVAVLVPGFVEELDEAHAALDQAAGQQAVVGEATACPARRRTSRGCASGSLRDVHQLGRARLHAEGHLERVDAGGDLGIADRRRGACWFSSPERVERVALQLRRRRRAGSRGTSTGSPLPRNWTPW